MSDSCRR